MKREEQINLYLKERNIPITSLEANSIKEGANWADRTMIERACKWLDVNFPEIENTGSWYKKSFIEQFKKAMEE